VVNARATRGYHVADSSIARLEIAMHRAATSLARRVAPSFAALAVLATFAGCRDRASSDAAGTPDSSLARDLAMARQQLPPQTVFNDAPIGGTTSAAPSAGAPEPKPAPPKARAPRPTPTPRRESPPAPVVRSPRPTPPAPVSQQPVPEPAPAPTPARAAGIIGAGSRVGMTTNGRVCARTALAGDKFTATVSSATTGTNGAVIPAGATVVLEVSSVDRADPIESSQIHFHVRAIDVNGEPYPADGEVATLGSMETVRSSSGNDRTKVIGGAVAGAVLGKIFGKSTKATVIGGAAGAAAGAAAAKASGSSDACLPEGTALRLTLSREIVVRRDGQL
jgi:outer membrane biosynthesis protein TonB